MNLLIWLQNWYQNHCDGDWEHLYGVKIDTLDNPGWSVSIDLQETELENKPFCEIKTDNGDNDWIVCSVRNKIFQGMGDAGKLTDIIRIFKEWAESYILELKFLEDSACYDMILHQQKYQIIAKDWGLNSILVGIAENGAVFSLDTEESEENYAVYIASSPEVFRKEIEIFQKFCESRSLTQSEEEEKQSAEKFRQQILKLDKNAFSDSENYWSVIAEEIEYGVI